MLLKKIQISVLLTLLAVFAFACGSESQENQTTSSVSTPTLIFVEDSGGNGYNVNFGTAVCGEAITVTINTHETFIVIFDPEEFLDKCGLICQAPLDELADMIANDNPDFSPENIDAFIKEINRICNEKDPISDSVTEGPSTSLNSPLGKDENGDLIGK